MSLATSPAIGSAATRSITEAQNAVASSSKISADREKDRIALRSSNLEIWLSGPKPPSGSLDSNMKKNTGFIKRIRQSLGVESRDQLIKEVATLNLDKYVDEVVQAIPEGLSKCANAKDFFAAAEVRICEEKENLQRADSNHFASIEYLSITSEIWRSCLYTALVKYTGCFTLDSLTSNSTRSAGRSKRER